MERATKDPSEKNLEDVDLAYPPLENATPSSSETANQPLLTETSSSSFQKQHHQLKNENEGQSIILESDTTIRNDHFRGSTIPTSGSIITSSNHAYYAVPESDDTSNRSDSTNGMMMMAPPNGEESDDESDDSDDVLDTREPDTLSDYTVTETPLPWGSVLAVSLVLFANNLNRLIIFPFLPFMVQDFFDGELGDTEIGYYAGYLGAAFSLGGFFGNLIWGSLADRFGRRPIMLTGLALTILTVTAFGFSSSFLMAVVVRFCWGLLNGNVGVGKTFLAEICDDSNQARGFATLGMLGGMARLVGPALGGILVLNADSPLTKTFDHLKFFRDYPYCLPTFVAGGFACIAFVMCYFWLPETLNNVTGCDGCCGSKKRNTHEEMRNKASASDVTLNIQNGTNDSHKSPLIVHQNGTDDVEAEDEVDEASLKYIFANKPIMLGILIYSSLAFVSNASNELFPLWILMPKEEHGFEFKAQQIGLILTFIGVFQILLQLMFPYITKKFGFLRTLQLGMIVFGVTCIGFPFLGYLNYFGTTVEFILITGVYFITVAGRLTSFTCVFVIIANACTPSNRGTVNGVGQSSASMSRSIAPIAAGISFAYSSTNNGTYPLNWMLDWHILSLVGFGIAGLVTLLPKDLDRKKKSRRVKK